MGLKIRILSFFIVIKLLCPLSSMAEVTALRIDQAAMSSRSDISVYFHLVDEKGNPCALPQNAALTGVLAKNKVKLSDPQSFQQSGEGIAYIFLVDVSRSLHRQQMEEMKKAISSWLEKMRPSDRAALIAFGETVTVSQDYTSDRMELQKKIKFLASTDNRTQLHQAIARGIELGIRKDNGLPLRRVMVILSDGEDDFVGGMRKEEVLAKIREYRVPLYAVGFANNSGKLSRDNDDLKKLGEFARESGGEFFAAGNSTISDVYATIQRNILASYLVNIRQTDIPADGSVQHLHLTLTSGSKTMTDGLDMRVMPRPTPNRAIWIIAGTCAILSLLAGFLFFMKRNARKRRENEERKRREVEAEQRSQMPVETRRLPETDRQAPRGVKVSLFLVGRGREREFILYLADRLTIGRGEGNDLSLEDDEVSKRHCSLIRDNNMIVVTDLNSTNGTLVNGAPIRSSHRLRSGDVLMVGRTELRVVFQ